MSERVQALTVLRSSDLTTHTQPWIAPLQNSVAHASALVGQKRAMQALQQAMRSRSFFSHAYVALPPGLIPQDILSEVASSLPFPQRPRYDWVYLANPEDAYKPCCVWLPAGSAESAVVELWKMLELPVGERQKQLDYLQGEFPSSAFYQYLEKVKGLTFEDLPGNELANVVVSYQGDIPSFEFCQRVTASHLFGTIKLQNIEGTVSSELHLIRPGAIHRANGGTLIIDAAELLTEHNLWRRLKHTLRTGQIEWPEPGEGSQQAIFYEPEPMPLDVKVLLTGPAELFHQLEELDPDFSNFFPFIADFSSVFYVDDESLTDYSAFLAYLQQKTRHRPFSSEGLASFLEWSTALCEHQRELSLDAIRLIQLIEEVDALANLDGASEIQREHVERAAIMQRYRGSRIAELNWRQIIEEQIQIDTSGEVVGQINGLTVVSMTGIEFGEPSRITATVHYGDGDIIDIERKSELSGSIHTKGVMILTAFLANLFAQREPMPLSATLVFEQSYHEVDGDSASLAELCALLSSLSELPINQAIAVTGAIDQFGNVQAVGGINEKISGYFEVCKARGLDGSHGVIIPASNQSNLHLSAEIRNAVNEGLFQVYTAQTVYQAAEKLMNSPCGIADRRDENTIFGRIRRRLQQVHQDQDGSKGGFWSIFGKN